MDNKLLDTNNIYKWIDSQKAIAAIEEILNLRVITIFISRDTSIAQDDVSMVYEHISRIGNVDRLGVVIYGPGGSGTASARIINLLRNYTKEITILIPNMAASAMTMLALGGDVILMGPMAYLTPIDTSLYNDLAPKDPLGKPVKVEITQIQKYIELLNSGMTLDKVADINHSPYALLSAHVHPLVIGSVQRAFNLSKMLTKEILFSHMDDTAKIDDIVEQLNDKFPTHSYPITLKLAKDLGIKAESLSNELQLQCNILFKIYTTTFKPVAVELGGIKTRNINLNLFESRDFRTTYFSTKKYVLDEKKHWIQSSSDGYYEAYAPKLTIDGIMKVQSVKDELLTGED